MTLFDRQIALEEEMQGMGIKRFKEGIQKAKEGGLESSTVYGQSFMIHSIRPLSEAITAYLKPKNGSHALTRKILAGQDSDVLAFLTIRTVLNSITRGDSMARVAVQIASEIEDEMRFRLFSQKAKALWCVLRRDLDKRVYQEIRKRKILVHSMNKASLQNEELAWSVWNDTDKYHVGATMLDLLIQATQLVEIVTFSVMGKKQRTEVRATDSTLAWIEKTLSRCELLTPLYMPTLIPPKPWTSPSEGGYHLTHAREATLVKSRNKNYIEELHHAEMPTLYAAVNAVQATPWRINRRVLDVVHAIWEAGHDGDGVLPARQDYPLPPKPDTIATNKEDLTIWKRSASKIHGCNAKLRSKRLQLAKMLYIADRFKDEAAIYFPHQLDFRGRLYAMPSYLTPQGDDVSKALLQFSEGKPIGEDGIRWLMIHAANSYGVDKCSLEARVQWVEENKCGIAGVVADPLGDTWWKTADKPWQFLAACFELSAAYGHPEYVSHLAVSVDGTCNGLQNFSAMLRDEVGGAATNLTPSATPNDIYQQVADVARVKVQADADDPWHDKSLVARGWLAYGFDRTATKRPVMVLPYGGTLYSSREYLYDYIVERRATGKNTPWGDDEDFTYAAYLAGHVWNSIGEVVIAARSAMVWLQSVAALAAKDGLPINWTTPVGFPVLQAYKETDTRRIKTMLGGQVVKSMLRHEVGTLDRRRQASGISPNFVHSMDAVALMLCVKRCLDAGLTSFGMVHDSYGTLAADMPVMARCLREAFVELYQHDVLEEFRNSVAAGLSEENLKGLAPVPPKGNLGLSTVLQSVYFFA